MKIDSKLSPEFSPVGKKAWKKKQLPTSEAAILTTNY